MRPTEPARLRLLFHAVALSLVPLFAGDVSGQDTEESGWTTQEDHQNMMDQLGIVRLRPGPSGRPDAPNPANYDPAIANPFPDLPEVLVLKNGDKVTSAEMWWQQRRPEIVEDFEREVVGRIPENVPQLTWQVTTQAVDRVVGGIPVNARKVIGSVDNSAHPEIEVNMDMTLVTPLTSDKPVPVLMMFGGFFSGGFPRRADEPEPTNRFRGFRNVTFADPPSTEQLIAAGWGYATISPRSIQADSGAGLTKGIIGLVNNGQPRKPDDWGSLRAWGWGASRGLDYLETDPTVDAKKVGIEGVSRYGKAALVTMAFDQRFAVVLVGSSGEGGAKLHRRNFGEAVENLTASGEYHWMAGNFLKYGAAESRFGSMNAGDIPVDAHQLIALCAPRPTFISYGIPEKGDALWLDQQGSYMATVAAGPVFRLLGAKDAGDTDDYRVAKKPPVNRGLLDGELAWRQHDGGHEDRTNMKHFIGWANRLLGHTPPVMAAVSADSPPARRRPRADEPVERTDENSRIAHAQLLEKARAGKIDLYFVGDSITRRWGATDYPELLAHWNENFFGWNAADFAWGGDNTSNILWRLENGELEGVNPKVIVILAGTNNLGRREASEEKIQDVTRGIEAIIRKCQELAPEAKIILTAIFPRNDSMAVMPGIRAINANIAKFADGDKVRFLNVNDRLADADGKLFEGVMMDRLHPALKGYQIWVEGLKPMLTELLGPPAETDHAPPPTGDPSAAR